MSEGGRLHLRLLPQRLRKARGEGEGGDAGGSRRRRRVVHRKPMFGFGEGEGGLCTSCGEGGRMRRRRSVGGVKSVKQMALHKVAQKGVKVRNLKKVLASEGLVIRKRSLHKRAPSAYNMFVKRHWHSVSGTPQQKMAFLAAEWRAQK